MFVIPNYHLDVVVSWEGALAPDRVDLQPGHDHVGLEPALVERGRLLPFVVLLHENEVNIAGSLSYSRAGGYSLDVHSTGKPGVGH